MEFKIGDKVKIPTQSTANIGNYKQACNQMAGYELDYLVITDLNTCKNSNWEVGLDMYSGKTLFANAFNFIDIELYEEEFPERWCLEITKESFPFIQKTYSDFEDFKEHTRFSNRYLKSDHSYGHRSIKEPSEEYPEITLDQFKKHILKESTIMKNLLETEFVIENCSLGQRAAIKHYCEEKGIKQLNLETPKFNVVTFSNRQFKCFLTSSVPRNKITFSELIQFLDKYQPEPEFKVGDFLITIEDSGNATSSKSYKKSYYGKEVVLEIEKFEDSSNGLLAVCKNGYVVYLEYMPIKFVRHATLEEIERWKEENEIKLPRIDTCSGEHSTTRLKWGCTTISIATVKELLKLKLTHINFEDGREADYKQIQQIKKFIEHNNL